MQYGVVKSINESVRNGVIQGNDGVEYFFRFSTGREIDTANGKPRFTNKPATNAPSLNASVVFQPVPKREHERRPQANPWCEATHLQAFPQQDTPPDDRPERVQAETISVESELARLVDLIPDASFRAEVERIAQGDNICLIYLVWFVCVNPQRNLPELLRCFAHGPADYHRLALMETFKEIGFIPPFGDTFTDKRIRNAICEMAGNNPILFLMLTVLGRVTKPMAFFSIQKELATKEGPLILSLIPIFRTVITQLLVIKPR